MTPRTRSLTYVSQKINKCVRKPLSIFRANAEPHAETYRSNRDLESVEDSAKMMTKIWSFFSKMNERLSEEEKTRIGILKNTQTETTYDHQLDSSSGDDNQSSIVSDQEEQDRIGNELITTSRIWERFALSMEHGLFEENYGHFQHQFPLECDAIDSDRNWTNWVSHINTRLNELESSRTVKAVRRQCTMICDEDVLLSLRRLSSSSEDNNNNIRITRPSDHANSEQTETVERREVHQRSIFSDASYEYLNRASSFSSNYFRHSRPQHLHPPSYSYLSSFSESEPSSPDSPDPTLSDVLSLSSEDEYRTSIAQQQPQGEDQPINFHAINWQQHSCRVTERNGQTYFDVPAGYLDPYIHDPPPPPYQNTLSSGLHPQHCHVDWI